MVLLHPGVWGGSWNTIIPVFWVSLYLFGVTVTGRIMARSPDCRYLADAVVPALLWPLLVILFGLAALVRLWLGDLER